MTLAFAVAGAVLLLLALHPFVTYPLSLRVLARLRPQPVRLGPPLGRAAFCVCAYNEERVIRAKVDNMLAAGEALGGLEVLVYVDGGTDGTADIVREYGDRVRLVDSPARLGKTHGMNTLAALTTADLLVFSDANVLFAPDALPRLLAPFADPDVGCVCGHLIYTRPEGNATAATGSLYWRLEETIKRLESATGSVMGADGSIFAMRRAVHEPPPPDLIDDMYISLASLCSGHRIVRAADALAYEEAVSRPAEEFRRKVRIACQAFNVHRALWPRLRRLPALDLYKYVSHKLLRWLTAGLLVAAAMCWAGAAMAAGAWPLLGAAAVLGAAAGLAVLMARSGLLATMRDILGAFIATAIGVWRSLARGPVPDLEPPGLRTCRPTGAAHPRGLGHAGCNDRPIAFHVALRPRLSQGAEPGGARGHAVRAPTGSGRQLCRGRQPGTAFLPRGGQPAGPEPAQTGPAWAQGPGPCSLHAPAAQAFAAGTTGRNPLPVAAAASGGPGAARPVQGHCAPAADRPRYQPVQRRPLGGPAATRFLP